VSASNHAALNAWTRGRAELAQQRIDDAMAVAQANNSPYDLAYVDFVALTSSAPGWPA